MLPQQKPVTFKNLVSFSITMSQLSELFVCLSLQGSLTIPTGSLQLIAILNQNNELCFLLNRTESTWIWKG